MGGGIKIFIKFKYAEDLFPKNAYFLYLKGEFLGVHKSSLDGRGKKEYIVWHSLLCGDDAEALKDKKDEELANILLENLKPFASDPEVMMKAYDGVYVKHWTNEKYIQGAYSYPGFGIGDSRNVISDHLGNVVFAGEYANYKHHSTISGAMETGRNAVEYLMDKYYGNDK